VNCIKHSSAGPGHALQESPAVDAILVEIVANKFCHDVFSPPAGVGCRMLAARGLRDVRLALAAFIPSK
jgi:hypothetical protein